VQLSRGGGFGGRDVGNSLGGGGGRGKYTDVLEEKDGELTGLEGEGRPFGAGTQLPVKRGVHVGESHPGKMKEEGKMSQLHLI